MQGRSAQGVTTRLKKRRGVGCGENKSHFINEEDSDRRPQSVLFGPQPSWCPYNANATVIFPYTLHPAYFSISLLTL